MKAHSEQAELVERLRRAVHAMDAWDPLRQVQYEIRLGVKDRKGEFTRDFDGEASPEPDSVSMLEISETEDIPVVRLLYVLEQADDICLDGPTTRSITGDNQLSKLLRVVKRAEAAGLARWTGDIEIDELDATDDEFSIVGLQLTDEGRRVLDRALERDRHSPALATSA